MTETMSGTVAAMAGEGSYNRHSGLQQANLQSALPLLADAARAIGEHSAGPVTIVDYGASQGRNSMAPMASAIVLIGGGQLPAFADILGGRGEARRSWAEWGAGLAAVITTVLAIQVALGLVFDPRYKDFPFAPLTAAIVPLALLAFDSRGKGAALMQLAERVAAVTLILAAVYILFNESLANWQSVWLCALLTLLALSLVRFRWSRAAQS